MRTNQSRFFKKLQSESDKMGAQFIKTELKLALYLLDIAGHSFNRERRQQLSKDASRSYDTVLQALPHLSLMRADRDEITAKLHHVRARLEQFGISSAGNMEPLRDAG
jgi:hypothetical protein